VLDIACGTGIVARSVYDRVNPGGSVAGIDASPQMLSVARQEAKREGRHIEWRQGIAESLPYPQAAFDLAFCQFALMFFENRQAAVSEMFRVLSSGGRALISVFQGIDRHPFYVELDRTIDRALGASGVGGIFAMGNDSELRSLFVDAGFESISTEQSSMTAIFPEPDSFLAGEIEVDTAAIPAMQQLDAMARQSLIASIQEEMQGPLRAVTEDGAVRIPFHITIAVAAKAA
jgi:SAM-dependent methyltransferase